MSLTLGSVTFRDMEVPEAISFGGRQDVNIQHLLDGNRFVEALGNDDGLISFSGIFTGNDAIERAQALDLARELGQVLPLAWTGFYYSVIIDRFEAEYRRLNLIPFTIVCVVADNPIADLATAAISAVSMVGDDLLAASGLAVGAGISSGYFSDRSLAGVSALTGVVSASLAAGGAALVAGVGGVNGAVTSEGAISAIAGLVTVSGQVSAQACVYGYASRALTNIGLGAA
jgi:hypothetical protein